MSSNTPAAMAQIGVQAALVASGLVGETALAGGFVQHGYRLGVSFLGGTLVAGRNSRVHLFRYVRTMERIAALC